MSLAIGTKLGPYEIVAPLGAGGMGEVYKAHDTRLDRLIAIKILPAALASSIEAQQRFEREAKAISRLSHPHICALYDVGHADGTEYLVMELLDGETLASRVAKGRLAMAQVLRYGVEIAEALAAAHRQGIVHRDLKPGNVMITKSGVKLVDFGLAKAIEPVTAGELGDLSTAALPPALTIEGTFLGTMPYMAPEQLQGQPADVRSDVFALGTVLYEMTTGRRAFAGQTAIAVASAIAHDDPPPMSSVQPAVPPQFDRLVRVCLAKDPDQRWQAAHDVAIQLAAIEDDSRSSASTAAVSRVRAGWLPWSVAAVAIAVALVTWGRLGRSAAPPAESIELQIVPPANNAFVHTVETVSFALSPDGTVLAFVARDGTGTQRVWTRPVASLDAKPIAGTEGAGSIFWSPDGRSIGFFAGGTLKRLDLAAGAAVPVCTIGTGQQPFGTWSATGQILFGLAGSDVIKSISTAGGTPSVVVKAEASRDEVRLLFPTFLPDGRRFLYLARLRNGEGVLMLGEAGKPPRRLMPVDSNVQYVEPGLLVFARGGTLVGQRFDAAAGQVAGEQVSIAASVRFFLTTGVAAFTASRSGSIVYQSSRNRDHLAWLDRSGRELEVVGSTGDYLSLRIARSGHTALFSRTLPATGTYDVWSLDLDRGGDTRLTTDDRYTEIAPVLLPGGGAMIFSKAAGRSPDLVRKNLGTGQEEVLLPSPSFRTAEDVLPDGRLAYSDRPTNGGGVDLWMLPLSGPPTPSALQRSQFNEYGLRFSPDGRYYLFLSNQSGRTEVYVSPVSGGVTTPASVGGEQVAARWSPDGREILYLSIDRRVVSVPVRTTPALELGTPATLFVLTGRPWKDFDVSADGKRFLAIVPEVVANEQPLTAILNWSATVRR